MFLQLYVEYMLLKTHSRCVAIKEVCHSLYKMIATVKSAAAQRISAFPQNFRNLVSSQSGTFIVISAASTGDIKQRCVCKYLLSMEIYSSEINMVLLVPEIVPAAGKCLREMHKGFLAQNTT